MRKVTVRKADLLETLKTNRETHEADFDIAWEKYREQAISNVTALLDSLKDLSEAYEVELFVNLSKPELHTDDFDRAIEMIDWEVSDEVELTEQEFQQYVQNNWHWMGKFRQDNVFYTGSASPSSAASRA